MRILIVEDDNLIARGIASGLRAYGLTADTVPTAAQAELALANAACDAIVLDRGLPDGDGLTLLARLRERGETVPVLLLTARDAVEDRIEGLQAGADDYLVKPFDLGELVARLHALMRRAGGRSMNAVEAGALRFDPSSGEAWLDGEPVELSRREATLLAALIQAEGRCLSTEQIKDRLYGLDQDVGSNAVNVHVHNLRRKLGADVVATVRGLGYRFGWAGR
ncbi:response regulator [Stenotrophomonas acidaminiphila]|uniref:response regulator n=1 Tax=Stenotrophomonas acidaminiphila TaxID=128780 RepID=UPI0013761C22|nr:response regulator [Stenotrophomonas acidaminiphila]NCT87254.1 response regulator [Stenotrophomonas acidaminiphila]